MKHKDKIASALLLLLLFSCLIASFPPRDADPHGLMPFLLYWLAVLYLPLFPILVFFISPIITPRQTKHRALYFAITSTALTLLFFFAALAWHSFVMSWFWLLLGNCIFLAVSIYDYHHRT